MMRFLLLLIIAALTFAILYFANHLDSFNNVWLYLVGLAGAIIKLFKVIWEKIKTFGNDLEKELQKPEPKVPPIIQKQDPNQAVG